MEASLAHRCLALVVCWMLCSLLLSKSPPLSTTWTRPVRSVTGLSSSDPNEPLLPLSPSSSAFASEQFNGSSGNSEAADGGGHASSNSKQGLRRRLPQTIVIGVRKCGTRALLEFLDIHPAVQKARDEVHFFDDDDKYALGLQWYRDQMPGSRPGQVTVEKSPAYFVTVPQAPSRIHAMNATIKLIVIVRDPVTRLISDYAQLAANKAAKRSDFRANNDGHGGRMASFERLVLLPSGEVDMAYKPIKTSIYGLYFSRWMQMFKRSQIHVVDGDRLVYDPFPEVQKVESFLGLEHKIRPDNFAYNATKGFFCVRTTNLNSSTSTTIPSSGIEAGGEKCLNESKGRRHPNVDPGVISTLRRFYAPYNRQFYKMVGQDFAWPEL